MNKLSNCLGILLVLGAVNVTAQNTFPATGSVGIGTTAPSDTLSIVGTSPYRQGQITVGDGGAFNPYIHSYRWTGAGSNYYQTTIGTSLSAPGALEFQTGNGGNAIGSDTQATRMLILPGSGNIGINSLSPSYQLDVTGQIRSTAGFVFPDGTSQTTAYVNSGVITASDPTYGTINLKLDGANVPVVTFTRWTGNGSVQQNAYAGLFYNALDGGNYDYGIGTGISQTGDQTVATNVVTVTQAGNVGIGTTTPRSALDINGNVTFSDGTVQATAWNGTTLGGDYAESVDVLGDRAGYEPGDVIVIDAASPGRFEKSGKAYSKLVAGVYSTKPGLVGRRLTFERVNKAAEVPMAMLGIVPTKVTTENGPIDPGDLLVSASKPGYAMKGTDSSRLTGAVLGKALAPLNMGDGVIEVMISIQ